MITSKKMAEDLTLPEDEEELADLYNETIEHHNEYLERLHSAFNRRCETIGADAKKKLDKVPKEDEEARNAVLQEEQEQLDKTLAELKYAINKSNANARKKLEQIQVKLEERELNIEEELANL